MSTLRPECVSYLGDRQALPNDTALFLIRDAVAKRRGLIHGQLDGAYHQHCALGCFWADNPDAVLDASLIEEVAAVNDSMKDQTKRRRWLVVNKWLRWKIKIMANPKEKKRGLK